MPNVAAIKSVLYSSVTVSKEKAAYFSKTGVGHYAHGDEFIGVTVPTLRTIAKEFSSLSLTELQELLESKINEERLLALLILVNQYKKASHDLKEEIYLFYMRNLKHINNWNLVDSSAHFIVGAHNATGDTAIIFRLAQSEVMWHRRIAMVSTWYFIRNKDLALTFAIATILLADKHDLIHKAVGWMLREAGKKDEALLVAFLDQHAMIMPRTMLRYAIEKFDENKRRHYLMKKV